MQLLAEYTVIYYYYILYLLKIKTEKEKHVLATVIFSVFILFRIE